MAFLDRFKKSKITEKEVIEETVRLELEAFKKIDRDVQKLIKKRRERVMSNNPTTYRDVNKSDSFRTDFNVATHVRKYVPHKGIRCA